MKKGISSLIATVLMILITIAAVGIITQAVIPVIKGNIESAGQCDNAKIEVNNELGYTCYDPSVNIVSISVSRGPESTVVGGLQIKLVDSNGQSKIAEVISGGNYTFIDSTQMPEINSIQTYNINASVLNITNIERVSVIPIIKIGKTSKVCGSSGVVELPKCSSAATFQQTVPPQQPPSNPLWSSTLAYWSLNSGYNQILNENFDDGVADGWTPQAGTWSVSGGAYHITDQVIYGRSTSGRTLTNGNFSATVRLIAGNKEGMLMFRSVSGGYYLAGTGGWGCGYAIGHANPDYNDACIGSSSTLPYGEYNFTVSLSGNNITLYNGQTVIASVVDSNYPTGGEVGLYAYSSIDDFDNVLVYAANNSIAVDSVGKYNGTLNGPIDVTGRLAGALEFDGSNDEVAVPLATSPSESVTMSAWIYGHSFSPAESNGRRIYESDNGILFTVLGDGRLRLSRCIGGYPWCNGWIPLDSTVTISLNTWTHVAGTYNSTDGVWKVFVNGVQYGTMTNQFTAGSAISSRGGPKIGAQPWTLGNCQWDGIIDEFGIWNRTLSDSEIVQLYNSGAGRAYNT